MHAPHVRAVCHHRDVGAGGARAWLSISTSDAAEVRVGSVGTCAEMPPGIVNCNHAELPNTRVAGAALVPELALVRCGRTPSRRGEIYITKQKEQNLRMLFVARLGPKEARFT